MDNFISSFFVGAIISFVVSFTINFFKLISATPKKESERRDKVISTADELLKFKSLLDEGIVTQKEFYQKKKQLLDKEL